MTAKLGDKFRDWQSSSDGWNQDDCLDACEDRIAEAEAAILAALAILMPLSMATEGHLRGRICTASNALNAALGRSQSSHGDKYGV